MPRKTLKDKLKEKKPVETDSESESSDDEEIIIKKPIVKQTTVIEGQKNQEISNNISNELL